MTASSNFEDRFLGRIGHRLNTTRGAADLVDVTSTPCARPTTTVWRRGDALPTPEATGPVAAKQRIPFRPSSNTPVIVAKPDPAIAAEAQRKAQALRDAKAADDRRKSAAREAKAARDALVAAEQARLETERAERDEAERLETERREALRIQAEKDEAERNKSASVESITVLVAAKSTPKAKAETPKVIEEPKRRKPGQGVSLEELRAKSAAPIQPLPRPTQDEINRQIGVAKDDGAGKRNKWDYKSTAEKPKPVFTPSPIPVFGPVPMDIEALNKRIAALDPRIVTNIHRGAVIKFRWTTTEQMVNANTDDSDTLSGLRSFVERCEKATVKAARKGK